MSDKKELITISTMHGNFSTVSITPTYARRKPWKPVDPKMFLSFIPGTIVEFYVSVGDRVSIGDKLLLFKAMKMDSTIYSEIGGIVKAIDVAVGDKVPKGKVLTEFE